jgi:hypothetical protein
LTKDRLIESAWSFKVAHRESDSSNSGHQVSMFGQPRHTLIPRCHVLDKKRNCPRPRRLRNREHPAQQVAVGPLAAHRHRVVHQCASLAKTRQITLQIISLGTEIDDSPTFVQELKPRMWCVRLGECDQLEVGAIAEGNQRIVAPDGVPSSRDYAKAQMNADCGRSGGLCGDADSVQISVQGR